MVNNMEIPELDTKPGLASLATCMYLAFPWFVVVSFILVCLN